jgi:hypothetical protein
MKAQRIGIWVSAIVLAILAVAASAWVRERQGYSEWKLVVDRQTAARELGFVSYLNEVQRIDSCPSSGIDFRFFSGECNRNDVMLVSLPKDGLSGLTELKASEYAGFEVGGKFRNTARLNLSESQVRKLREDIISKVPDISPLASDESSGRWKSVLFEACLNGNYYAATRDSEHRDPAFDDLERTLMTTLDVQRMWSPETPTLLCL